jgi:ferredoxin
VKVVIDPERCTGHGRCYALAPEVFDADDRGLGLVKGDGDVTSGLEHAARRAVANCPESAIAVVD